MKTEKDKNLVKKEMLKLINKILGIKSPSEYFSGRK